MPMDAAVIFTIVGWAIGTAISLAALYFVVRAAILSALREHTMNSTMAVSVVSANPIRIASSGEPVVPADGGSVSDPK